MYSPLNRPVFVKRKHNLLSAGADLVSPIIIVYQLIVRLFSCGLRSISIRYLPAVLPIKGWIYLHNHVTYAHNSGIRRRIYGKSALYMLYCPLMDCYFYTSANGDFEISVSRRVRAPFTPGYPYFDIRLYRNSVIALSG